VDKAPPKSQNSLWLWIVGGVVLLAIIILLVWRFLIKKPATDDTTSPNPDIIPVINMPCSLATGKQGTFQYDGNGKLTCTDSRIGKPCRITPNANLTESVIISDPNSGIATCKRIGSLCLTPASNRGKIANDGTCKAIDNAVLTDAQQQALLIEMQKSRGG
jgi:hypothetical protein